MADNNSSNERRDPRVRKGKFTPAQEGDVLRAKDIIPPYGDDVTKPQRVQKAEQVPPAKDVPAVGKPGQDQSEIPKFDLAEKIMAEQRKVSARRRKRPTASARKAPSRIEFVSRQPAFASSTEDTGAEPSGHAIEQPGAMLLEQEQIIAEIVARDIERLRRSGNGE